MVDIYPRDPGAFNGLIARMPGVLDAIHDKAERGEDLAKVNLAEARASTHWSKIFGASHETRILAEHRVPGRYGGIDSLVIMEADNPMAIEYGHQPSGVFGPGGKYGHIDTKSPDGLYILTRALGMI